MIERQVRYNIHTSTGEQQFERDELSLNRYLSSISQGRK